MLLAYTEPGRPIVFDAANRERFAAYRAACRTSNAAFLDMLRAERLTLATDRLAYFAHWITPEEQPIRFDTRFFAAPAPPTQSPEADGHDHRPQMAVAVGGARGAGARGDHLAHADAEEPRARWSLRDHGGRGACV